MIKTKAGIPTPITNLGPSINDFSYILEILNPPGQYQSHASASSLPLQNLPILGDYLEPQCLPDIGGETLDGGCGVPFRTESLLDGLAHALLHDVDVVVVQPQVAHAVLDQTTPKVHELTE